MGRSPGKPADKAKNGRKGPSHVPHKPSDEIAPAHQLRVLIIDDDAVDRMTLRRALDRSKLNPVIEETGDIASGLQALRTRPFDVVLLDHILPDGKSIDLLRQLRTLNIKLPVVVTTGFGDEMLVVDMLKAGAADYLPKDHITADSVSKAISHAIRLRRSEDELAKRDVLLEAGAEAATLLHTQRDRLTVVSGALAILGRAAGADRVIAFEQHAHPVSRIPAVSHRFEWARDGDDFKLNDPSLQNKTFEELGIPRWHAVITSGHTLGGPVRTLPEAEQAPFMTHGILSILVVPVMLDGRCWGFVYMEDRHSERVWTEREKTILLTIATGIGSSLMHHRADEALRQSEERYRRIVEDQADIICRCLPDGTLTFVNEAYCHLVGLKREELIGRCFISNLPEARRAEVVGHLASLCAAHPIRQMETLVTRANGEPVWIQWISRAIVDGRGVVVELQATARDITTLKQAESNAVAQRDLAMALVGATSLEDVLRTAVDKGLQLAGLDAGGIYLPDARTAAFRLEYVTGVSMDFMEAIRFVPFDSPRGRLATARKPVYMNVAGMKRPDEELPREGLRCFGIIPVTYQGQIVACLNAASHTLDTIPEHGRMVLEAIAGQIGNAIVRLRAENALHESEEQYRALLENLSVGVFRSTLDTPGQYLLGNQAFARILGFDSVDELLKTRIAGHYHVPSDRQRAIEEVKLKGSIRGYEVLAQKKDGTPLWLSLNAVLTHDDQGEPLWVDGVVEDITERKKAAEELRRSREYLDRIIDTIADPVFVKDRNHCWVTINNALCELLGRPRDQILGRNDAAFFPPDQVRVFWEHDDLVFSTGQENINEEYITDASGVRHVIVTKKTRYQEPDGRMLIVGIIRDMTASKRAEEALRASEERFRAVFETARDSIFIKDRDLRYIQVNPAMEELFGAPAASLLGKTDDQLFGAEAGAHISEVDARVLRGEVVREEHSKPVGDTTRCFDVSKAPMRNAAGAIVGLCGIARDITLRKDAEQALKESESRFREFAEMMPQTVFEMNLDGRATFVNRAALELWGYTEEDFRNGITCYDMVTPDSAGHMRRNLQARLAGDRPANEYTAQRKDGTTFPVLIYSVPILRDGRPIGVRGLVVDITDRKKAEEAVRESERRYRSLAEGSPDMIYLCAPNGDILYCNALGAQQFGTTPDELVKKSQEELFGPDVAAQHRRTVARVCESGQPFYAEVGEYLRHSKVWIDTRLVPIKNEAGRATGVLGISRDISRRRQMEDALRDSEANFRALAENALDGILIAAGPDVCMFANKQLSEMVGRPIKEILGMSIYELVTPSALATLKERFADRLAGRPVPNRYESMGRKKDGTLVPVELAVTMTTWQGKPATLIVVRDISERLRIEEERRSLASSLLEVQEKERKEISSMLHDHLGQLLTLTRLELGSVGVEGDTAKKSLDNALQRLDEALGSVRRLAVSLRPPILDDLGIEVALETLTEEFSDGSSIQATFTHRGPTPALSKACETCLYRVLQEALTNVAKHSGATEIQVALRSTDSEVRLEVRDNGRGFDPKVKMGRGGIGIIGMRERLARCNGTLEIVSTPGQGTIIMAAMPVVKDPDQEGMTP